MHFTASTLDDLLRTLYPTLMERGVIVEPSRGLNRELLGVQLELDRPRARLSRSETRGRPFSALGEFLWYLTGDNRLDFIVEYIPAYAADSEDGQTVHGGYGPRIFGQRGHNQLENVINQLRASSTSRRAMMQIFNAEDISRRFKETPCTATLQFLLRDGKLQLITTMRSNDAYLGLPHDVFCFTMLQELVARILGVELGTYRHFVGSMHLYEKHHPAIRRYLDEGFQRQIEMPSMPSGDPWPSIQMLLEVEQEIRVGKTDSALLLELAPYWADLARLLQVHFAQGDEAQLSRLRAGFVFPGYRVFVDGKRGRPIQELQETQGTPTL